MVVEVVFFFLCLILHSYACQTWLQASVDGSEGKEDVVQAPSISNMEHKFSNFQKPFKKQRLSLYVAATENGDASSDSDKDVNLTAEERRKRESRSKRFDRGHGNPTEKGHFKSKVAGASNLHTRRATALILSKTLDDTGSRAVEDIDWDALTVRGTCQEIEKRYLRLTSAPDPATVSCGFLCIRLDSESIACSIRFNIFLCRCVQKKFWRRLCTWFKTHRRITFISAIS